MTDVVNLIFAMTSLIPTKMQEGQVAEHVDDFREQLIEKKDLSDLWIPAYFVMDAESDDTMSWVLLKYIHNLRGTKLQTFIQLPADSSLDEIAAKLEGIPDAFVFRDPNARNLKPVQKNFGITQKT